MKEKTTDDLEKEFKKFKKKYFKGRDSFTGVELVECKYAFWNQVNLKALQKP
jgi:hypothetical protein